MWRLPPRKNEKLYWGIYACGLKVQKKLRETKFFFGQMSQSAGSTNLDHDHLEFYLSAFLSAARSVTEFFEYRPWLSQWKASQSVEDVPLSKIKTPSALHAAYASSFGEPWGEVKAGVKVYYFMLEEKSVPVIETCNRYVALLERAVEDFSKA